MNFYRTFLAVAGIVLLMASSAQATVISGTATSYYFNGGAGGPSSTPIKFGDGVHSVTSHWGATSLHHGYIDGFFYPEGDAPIHYSDVAFAVGVTDISQITDASIFSFSDRTPSLCDAICDPDGVGDFVVVRNVLDGYYGVLRIDKIDYRDSESEEDGFLQATWWFQTDGTGNFVSPVPEPSSYLMLGIGMLILLGYRVRDLALIKPV
ncbi:MAG: PEP-CTERM sorting domain-containing protein [Nitrosomonas sp.]|uniref:PEP-CTERM sorting domain-containing protein n=1 Tax=Nitrosomonas sp. TaxID=42353 RepID=UPI001E138B0E|nr:PEP-CTERM sorting domain-containing protein [Nitrosomonas sp.]MBX9893636.1 PEP-CTERM sorting domain-containing protein [Nitrosomonas sp.]